MKCIPCRINYNNNRYRIYEDGSVSHALSYVEAVNLGLTAREILDYEAEKLDRYLAESNVARTIRREASRLRRNRNARERTQAMKDLGLRRGSGGAFGGWE